MSIRRPVLGTIGTISTISTIAALAALAATFVLVGPATTGPAGAHSETGTVTVEATPTAPLVAHVKVLVRHANDGDAATGATVSATATSPGAPTVGPVPLADTGKGNYEGDLTLSRAAVWTVTVTSANPTGTGGADVTVTDAPVATTRPTTPRPTTPPTTARRGPGATTDGSGPSGLVVFLVVLVGVAVVTATVTIARSSRRRPR